MNDLSWRVRVRAGEKTGAGILVDERQVLTCAHVVLGQASATVSIDGLTYQAKVWFCTEYAKDNDPGDVAVLRLERRVRTAQARFAGLDSLREEGSRLLALGFPTGYDELGRSITLTTDPGLLSFGQESQRILVEHKDLDSLKPGYSGAGVYRMDTQEVVGMISSQDRAQNGATGLMLPLSSLRRYWSELDDHIPFEWLSQPARHTLRAVLAEIRRPPEPDAILADAFPAASKPPPPGLSLWDAVVYVGEEHLQESAIAHFLRLLIPALEPPAQNRLNGWFTKWLPAETPPLRVRTPEAFALVRVDREMDKTTVTVESLVGRTSQFKREISIEEGAETDEWIQKAVEELLHEACLPITSLDPLIEFALPEGLFRLPVETWLVNPQDQVPVGIFPVVIRDIERLSVNSWRAQLARRRWETLRTEGASPPIPVPCDRYQGDEYRPYILPEDVCVLMHATCPSPDQLKTALSLGMPVMMWPRSPCPSTAHQQCRRELNGLIRQIQHLPADAFPHHVKTMRDNAGRPRLRRSRRRFGKDLILFWDDPARSPEPPTGMGG
ncbi:trypsin-like peptidase domain-containing protein [Actinomadura nitritigenes]|uniref:VMAP-C domain-containing protein n=1 Tax=Actinomadura nitritigenes TaxID=134602 RepID=UPI003D8ECFF3